MTTIYRCNRCKTDGDLFSRHLDVNTAGPITMMDPSELDLCGYCWSKFIEWLQTSWPEATNA